MIEKTKLNLKGRNEMQELKLFSSDTFGDVRLIEEDGKLLYCGADIAKALKYARPNDAISAHCKGTVKRSTLTNGGNQEMLFITEGDVYRLISRSKLPEAEKFERWLFDEVVPTVVRHGAYMTPETIEAVLLNPDTIIKIATELKLEREKRIQAELLNQKQTQIIGELKPKADYLDHILSNPGLVTITQISKDYGMSGQAMNAKLAELGVQSGQWLLYKKYHSEGYTHSETVEITRSDGRPDVKMNTKWTQKGRIFIYNLLKDNEIYPLIETSQFRSA